jgi:molybdopterin/thiamine biosynthesis adenylyltransferase/rhodanese-related sulfurtransferase
MTPKEHTRYSRHTLLQEIGVEGQEKLKKSSVFVIGAGGLGCPALLYLTAAGVGRIGIADFDVVEESNLQRQVLYTTEDLGLSKSERAKERLQLLNPLIKFDSHNVKVTSANVFDLLKSYDIVLDGSDNFSTRYLINDACVLLGKPLVYGSVFKFEGQVSVFNYKGGPTYRCLYPHPPKEDEVLNCSEVGVMGVLPGIIGSLQANEVIKMITGAGEVLSGKLLLFDALNTIFNTISFTSVAANKEIKDLIDYDIFCGVSKIKKINASELKKKLERGDSFNLIDVRNKEEFERFNIGGSLIPMNEIEKRKEEISKKEEIIVICQSGKRSATVAAFLLKEGYINVLDLEGGLNTW